MRAENGISHIQSSSAVLNLPPSSSHSLAGEAQLQNRRKKKVQKAEPSEEGGKTHSTDFSPVLAWFLPPPLLTLSFMAACSRLLWVLKTSLCWKLLPFWVVLGPAGGNPQRRHRDRHRVWLCGWTACEWAQQGEVKVTGCLEDCDSCLQSKLSLSALPELEKRKKEKQKGHTLLLLHTGTLLSTSLTVLDWVCLCILTLLTLPPHSSPYMELWQEVQLKTMHLEVVWL